MTAALRDAINYAEATALSTLETPPRAAVPHP